MDKQGIGPRRSSSVCILIAAFVERKSAHGNSERIRAPRKIATSANLCESESCQQDSRVDTMGQFGFFDADRRLAAITAKGDPLEMIARVVPFESFRAEIEAAVLTPVSEKKRTAGRKPIDVMVMFRMLVLQSLYNLSDEQVEYQVRDRLSFTRFLGLGIPAGEARRGSGR